MSISNVLELISKLIYMTQSTDTKIDICVLYFTFLEQDMGIHICSFIYIHINNTYMISVPLTHMFIYITYRSDLMKHKNYL